MYRQRSYLHYRHM